MTLMVLPLLSACGGNPVDDNDANITTQNLPFQNLSEAYTIKNTFIETYYIDNSNVPYISVVDLIISLNGFFDADNGLRYRYYPNYNNLVLTKSYSNGYKYQIHIFWDENKIIVPQFNYFYSIIKSNQETNYSRFIENTGYYSSGAKAINFDLGSYYFDILYYNNRCLMPLVIFNMLFCSQNGYNIFYNGESYHGYSGEIDPSYSEYSQIYESELNGTECPDDIRHAAIYSMLFAFDYFYGLKKDKQIDYFENYVLKGNMDCIKSTDPLVYMQGYRNILQYQLDELHTRINSVSNYNLLTERRYYLNDCGPFWNEYYSTKTELTNYKNEAFPNGVDPVRYQGDTAIITLSSFTTGSNSDILDNNGHLKDDAWMFDSYYYMKHCLEDIEEHEGIQDILLDLSSNGGGNVGAMMRVLGFLTDDVLRYSLYNTLTKEYSIDYYKVDTNGDNAYDFDAYDNYRWTILTSINTFSAANAFVSCVREQGLAKIIGQQTGGGMCSVLPLLLADGTAITISSQNTIRFVKKEGNTSVFYAIEHGFLPSLDIDYSEFYHNELLVDYIDQVNG